MCDTTFKLNTILNNTILKLKKILVTFDEN